MSDEASAKNAQNKGEQKPDDAKGAGGPLALQFPPALLVWNESRRLVADRNSRVESLALCCAQDPVLAIELLRISNAMYFSGGKAPITSLKTAIVRLGNEVVQETLENLKARPEIGNEDIRHWFEAHRNRCKRTAIVAKIIGEAVARTLSDDCEAAALFSSVGDMLAAMHFGEAYVALAEEHSRSGVNYRLAQDHKFDVEKMGLNYLRRLGIPEALVFAIDRDARPRSADRAIMKPTCAAAQEMVEAFDQNRWEKLTPGKTLPPKSSVRMLQIADAQYLKIYERVSEYLFAARQQEEKNKQEVLNSVVMAASAAPAGEESALQAEINDIMEGTAEVEEEEYFEEQAVTPQPAKAQTIIKTLPESLVERNEMFSLNKLKGVEKKVPRVQRAPKPTPQPVMRTQNGAQVISSVASVMDSAKSSEELFASLLQMLVDQGPFEKSALIVVSKDRKHAIVVAARGPNIGNGQKLSLDDPLSPLAQCFSKVQSFGNKSNAASPFGSKAFALAPVDADHETPVALYADCGNNGSLSFDARRVFRTVIEILNQKLPSIPGGIPVEI